MFKIVFVGWMIIASLAHAASDADYALLGLDRKVLAGLSKEDALKSTHRAYLSRVRKVHPGAGGSEAELKETIQAYQEIRSEIEHPKAESAEAPADEMDDMWDAASKAWSEEEARVPRWRKAYAYANSFVPRVPAWGNSCAMGLALASAATTAFVTSDRWLYCSICKGVRTIGDAGFWNQAELADMVGRFAHFHAHHHDETYWSAAYLGMDAFERIHHYSNFPEIAQRLKEWGVGSSYAEIREHFVRDAEDVPDKLEIMLKEILPLEVKFHSDAYLSMKEVWLESLQRSDAREAMHNVLLRWDTSFSGRDEFELNEATISVLRVLGSDVSGPFTSKANELRKLLREDKSREEDNVRREVRYRLGSSDPSGRVRTLSENLQQEFGITRPMIEAATEPPMKVPDNWPNVGPSLPVSSPPRGLFPLLGR